MIVSVHVWNKNENSSYKCLHDSSLRTIRRFIISTILRFARIRGTLNLRLDIVDVYAWSDSEIVLSWLLVLLETFKVFVPNRIHKIQLLLSNCHWNHVASVDNTVDYASRWVVSVGVNIPRIIMEGSRYEGQCT